MSNEIIDKIDKWILAYIKNRGVFIEPLRKIGYEATAKITTLGKEAKGWHKVVVECEKILDCKDTAESSMMSNLPNLVRDLKSDKDELLQLIRFFKKWEYPRIIQDQLEYEKRVEQYEQMMIEHKKEH